MNAEEEEEERGGGGGGGGGGGDEEWGGRISEETIVNAQLRIPARALFVAIKMTKWAHRREGQRCC